MTVRHRIAPLILAVAVVALAVAGARAQAPRAAATPATPAATAHPADMLQLMRGIMFPNSNVIFAAQGDDPETVKRDADPSTATNPLASTYGGWMAVENSGMALAESASLLEVPRNCSTGKPAPITHATWKKGVMELRAAGLAAAAAGRAKNQDQVVDASDKMTTACGTCHDAFREVTPRCVAK
jgi:hypothetical protein